MANLSKPGETKRVRISKAQRLTLAEVLVASLIVGACVVMGDFIVKYIGFNSRVIDEKNSAIMGYDQALRQLGVCADKDKNGRLSDVELEECQPNATTVESVTNSLRYNVYEVMAQNMDLEKVARKRDEDGVCYNADHTLRDYVTEYNQAKDDQARERALAGAKLCSSLRVISDALPAQKNTEALMSSLNQLFIEANVEPQAMAPSDDRITSEIAGVGVIPVTFRVEEDAAGVMRVLDALERSIREFDLTSAIFEWSDGGLHLRAEANAYYLSQDVVVEAETVVTQRGITHKSKTKEE